MRKNVCLVLTLALIFSASSAFAIFPSASGLGYPNALGDGTADIQLYHGWWQGADVWYHTFTTNNIRVAQTEE